MTTLSNKQAEALCGITVKRLQQLAAQGIIPAQVDGQWPFPGTVTALFKYYRDRRESKEYDAAKLAKLQAEAKLAELSLAEKQRDLVDVHELAAVINRFIGAAKAELWSWQDLDEERRREMLLKLGAIYEATFTEAQKEKEANAH